MHVIYVEKTFNTTIEKIQLWLKACMYVIQKH